MEVETIVHSFVFVSFLFCLARHNILGCTIQWLDASFTTHIYFLRRISGITHRILVLHYPLIFSMHGKESVINGSVGLDRDIERNMLRLISLSWHAVCFCTSVLRMQGNSWCIWRSGPSILAASPSLVHLLTQRLQKFKGSSHSTTSVPSSLGRRST